MAKTVTIEAMILQRNDRSLYITTTGDRDDAQYIPTSQIKSVEILHPDEEIYSIEITEWLAIKEGLI